MLDQIYSYREMCDLEDVQTLQRGMNFRMKPGYSVILMSQRSNAPYSDRVLDDGITIEYEGHDVPKSDDVPFPKMVDQPSATRTGKLTQNGLFADAVARYKREEAKPELVKVYEKIIPGVWSLKGFFDLVDYEIREDGQREVFVFILRLSETQEVEIEEHIDLAHTRLIPSHVKKEVWIRDGGKCVICGATKNLHFDHDLPFSKGGTSLTAKNIKLMCATHNLQKGARIE